MLQHTIVSTYQTLKHKLIILLFVVCSNTPLTGSQKFGQQVEPSTNHYLTEKVIESTSKAINKHSASSLPTVLFFVPVGAKQVHLMRENVEALSRSYPAIEFFLARKYMKKKRGIKMQLEHIAALTTRPSPFLFIVSL